MEMPSTKPSEIASSLQLLAQIHKPTFLWGLPGVGNPGRREGCNREGIRLTDIRAILIRSICVGSRRSAGRPGPS
jgi:hypothetical protein